MKCRVQIGRDDEENVQSAQLVKWYFFYLLTKKVLKKLIVFADRKQHVAIGVLVAMIVVLLILVLAL